MSNEMVALAQKRVVGSATKKAILVYLSDRASDDGSGIWTSKAHIAADTELSKRSVQTAMNEFERDGLLRKTGTKKCQNGFTYEYQIVADALKALPSTRENDGEMTGAGDSPVQEIHPMGCRRFTPRVQEIHPTGAGDSPHGVQEIHPNHPRTILEPINTPIPPEGGDLFSASQSGPLSDEPAAEPGEDVDAFFDEWWGTIWPKHQRKAGKSDCRDLYRKIVTGKYRKADQIAAQTLNDATRRYIASVSDRQYLKAPLAWLRGCKWEPFVGGGAGPDGPRRTPYSERKRAILSGEAVQ